MNAVGFVAPLVVYAVVTVLHVVVPARDVSGYVVDPTTKEPLRYRLNGLLVFALTLGGWALACERGWLSWGFFWDTRWEGLAGACTLGFVFTFAVVLTAPTSGRSLLADLYLGRRENPQWRRIDGKMWLYLVGATMLGLNLASFAAHHALAFSDASPGVFVHVALFGFFLCEYLFFERVHLYTYDFVAERVGFKLGWGCLVFYPYFYAVGLWSAADRASPQTPAWVLVLAVAAFFVGWSFARGANLQKYTFKRDPKASFLGIAPVTVERGDQRLLVSGFWRVSRHVNYLGEILMATGLTVALGGLDVADGGWVRWLYPLYYVALLVPRQIDDDRRCAEKYGALWTEYCRRVPYRIVPGVY